MSRENVDLVRRCVAAVNERAVPDEIAPDFRMENVATAVTDRTYYGREGFREWIRDFFDVLDEEARHEAVPIESGDNYVIAKLRIVGRGAGSGAPVDLRWYGVMWIRDGKVTRAVGYASRREALRAVGLRE